MVTPFILLFKNKYFPFLWASQIFSQLTINIINFTLVTRIFEQTGSTIAVSLLWVTYALPAVLFLPLAGPIVDTVSRKSILFFTNLLQGAVVLLFLGTGDQIYSFFPLVFLYSALNQFYIPAEAASIPDVVTTKDLPFANSLFLITTQITFILGFGAGGPLFSLFGPKMVFVIGSLLLLIAAISVTFLSEKASNHSSLKSNLILYWTDFAKGLKYLKNEKGVLFPIIILSSGFALLSVMGAIFPLIGTEILSSSVRNSGVNIFIPAGIGALVGSILTPKLIQKFRKRRIIEAGLTLITLVLVFLSLFVPTLVTFERTRLIMGMICIFLIGISAVTIFIPSQTVIQERTPQILRGRILSTMSFFVSLASLIPLIFGAAIAELLSIKAVLLLIAGATAITLYYSTQIGDRYILKNP